MHGTYSITPAPRSVFGARVASRPTHACYVRRRVVVLTVLMTLVLGLGLAAQHGLADRGGGPAPASTAGPEPAGATAYVVQPGDTIWSIAARTRHGEPLADYVDALVALHGGTVITVGEALRLP